MASKPITSTATSTTSTTTTKAMPGVKNTMTNNKHIILPNPSMPTFNSAARILPSVITEQFAVLNACIRSGSMDRADRVMGELFRTRPDEMSVFIDTNIFNSFLNGFVQGPQPSISACLGWFERMVSLGIIPDADTYAILVKGFLKMKSYHSARVLLQDMRCLISESQGSTQHDIQELLKELEIAADDRLGKETVGSLSTSHQVSSSPSPSSPSSTLSNREIYENIPEVKPTDAIGVKFLQEQLSALQNSNEALKMDPYELQLELEKQGYEMALQKLKYMKETSKQRGDSLGALHLSPLKKIMWSWHERLIPLVQEEMAQCEKLGHKDAERRTYGPFLKLLPAEKLSIITILELLRLHNSSGIADGMKTARAVIDIGKAIEMEYNATMVKKNGESPSQAFTSGKSLQYAVKKMYEKKQQQKLVESTLSSSSVINNISNDADPLTTWNPVWPSSIRAKVGSVLTSLLIDAAKIPVPSYDPDTGEKIIERIPAFFHTYQYVRGKRVGIIKFSDQLTQLISKEPLRDTLHPRLLPMIVHPRPWLRYDDGGYLTAKSMCMRIKDSPEQLVYLNKASENANIDLVLKGLDVLGSTKWRVNKQVFDVILEAWNTGEAIADIPPAIHEPLPLPPKPDNYQTDPKAKFNWVNRVKEIQTMEKNYHSLRCDVNYKVETARAFLNLPMYFPHNMDFRGRAYPIPPTLNHLGNDLCRGILCFDEPKPLGDNGWKWLKIHLANLYGYDKHSFTERENFTMENLNNIFDSVKNPLTGNKWWLQAENPWQCLAACYEVAAAVDSGKPTEFLSRLPVHQDGTCNGLQHYAALGGDLAGARAVNLAPSDRPADVYTGVAEIVNRLVEKEAEEGNPDAQLLVGKISRKVVKQTVMTNVYGVTFIGARAQIENRLKERDDIPPERVYALAGYLAKKVFSSLGEMFNGARNIQDWLTDSAKRIARSIPKETLQETGILPFESKEEEEQYKQRVEKEKQKAAKRRTTKKKTFSARQPSANQMTSVIWTTPLGLPIVQPYRRSGKKQVTTLLQTVFIEDPDAARPVNATKQSTAFPPNFVHSLDATHMLMSAVACYENGLTFASVHDSYWTHACDVDTMNKIIRDQFIELHSQPIMEDLYNEFKERYKDYRIPAIREIDKKKPTKKSSKTKKSNQEELELQQQQEDIENEGLFGTKKSKEETAENQALFGLSDDYEDDDYDEFDVDGEEGLDDELSDGKKKRSSSKYEYSWEELTFAPLPKKGEFDINEVKKSDYFFH
ncbi:hypothetical protein BJ944DRAFT_170100 [Cunninghamella echinulata]|nr:hypothetical protein BJ944DRAFT_170100 [Cunninghamella echinulata]